MSEPNGARFVPTDIGNAERLIAAHGFNMRYVFRWKSWMVFDGVRWRRDETGFVDRACKATLRAMLREAFEVEDPEKRGKMIAHATASESNGRIRSMIERARAEPAVAVAHDVFDARPMLLTVANGTVDLETGRLLPHDRAHYSSKLSPIAYDPEALCPAWERFLLDVFDRRLDIIDYVQRAVGYSLTGDTSERCMQLMHGSGSNGKSTFLEVLQAVFGDYGVQADFATFLETNGDGPRNDIARLAGARMVRSSEVGEGKRLAESLVKTLTGNDTVAARFLYSEAFEFRPTFKLWFAANHKPIIRGTDPAIWHRVRLLPFTVEFLGDRKDKYIKEKLLAELPGILAWAVAGCLLWQRNGLGAPADVVAATDEYRKESDVIGAFLDDCCELAPSLEVSATELYRSFKSWAKDNGEYELSQTAFGRRLDERGFGVKKSGIKYRMGMRLLHSSQAPREDRPSWLQ